MPKQDVDPYAGTSGLKDDYDGKIDSVLFTYDSDYNDGKTCIARVEITAEDGEEVVLKLSTGSGWEPAKKGKEAQREDGKEPGGGFNRSCGWMVFFRAAFECDGAESIIRENGLPWETSALEGMSFHFNQSEYEDMNKQKRNRVVPTALVGGKAAKKGKDKPAKDDADSDDDATELPKGVKKALTKIAAASKTHTAFQERAYSEIDDADKYEAIIDDDSDEGFYETNS